MKRWFRDTLFLRLFLLMWVTLVISHVAAFGLVTSGILSLVKPPGAPGRPLVVPTFPSLPPTPGLPGEARGLRGPPDAPGPHPPGERPALPAMLLVVDYAVRLAVIGAAAALGARWLTAPMRRLVSASGTLQRALAGHVQLPSLDERSGTVEVREAARVFNGMARNLDDQFKSRALLMASLSHDLKTPLTRIRMRLESIADQPLAQRCVLDVQEANALLDLALGIFQEEASEEPVRTVDVTALLQSIVDDMLEEGHPVSINGAAALAVGRPLALRRVFENLLSNAVRYGENGSVLVETSTDAIRVRIDDTGPGIAPELLETVFQPFYRVEASRNRATGGTGLGLHIARDLLRRQGGDIRLANLPDGGLRAEVTLPLPRQISGRS
jgi:signal transduction histidine kinase